MKAASIALVPALLAGLTLAQDPPPPPGGFPVGEIEYAASNANGPITWVDGVQTEIDLYYPVAVPPPTGWPAVLAVHGGQGTRKNPTIQGRCKRLTAMGYVCLAYDARGDGATVVLNPVGFAATEGDKIRDMADAFQQAPLLLPAGVTMDGARLAVTGESQGGRHSYRAAAWSGLALPLPFGAVTHMPVIGAIAPRVAPLSPADDVVQQGILMNAEVACNIYLQGQPTDPQYVALLAEDYAAIYALRAADPLQHYLPGVLASTVPILIGNVWTDAKHALAPTVDALAQLPVTIPHRVVWSANGHSTPKNQVEELFTDDLIRRWFDRFLKGIANNVEHEPFAEVAVQPADPLRHADPDSAWGHALVPAWPPSGTTTAVRYLRGGARLGRNAPGAVEVGPTLQHRVLNGYSVASFCADDRVPNKVLPNLPLVSASFTDAVANDDVEVLGRPRVIAEVDASSGDFYVQAALFDVDPSGSERFVCAGSSGVRGGAAGRHALTIELDDTAYVLPAGHRLQVKLENLPLHRPPSQNFFRWVPCFTDSDVTLVIEPAVAPRLEVPVPVQPHALLSPRIAAVSAASGVMHPMLLEAGSTRANRPYLALMSASGYSPGFALGATPVPLNPDAWTAFAALVPNTAPFVAFGGLTDARGQAPPSFAVGLHPVAPALAGLRFAFTVVGLGPQGWWASAPSELTIRP